MRIEDDWSIRLGLNYVSGLRKEKAAELVQQRALRPFASMEDLLVRVRLNKADRRTLAKIGALNCLSQHRRAAQWDVEALYDPEDLFSVAGPREVSPLRMMDAQERLQADYSGTSVTTGPHPMALVRDQFPHLCRATDLIQLNHGQTVTIGGMVICRQRPGTAKGHVFISLEDETGIANAIVRSELFERLRLVITHESSLESKDAFRSSKELFLFWPRMSVR